MVTALLFVFSQCSENEVVAPQENPQRVAESNAKEDGSARKSTGKYLSTPVTGTINGLPFTAEYHITEFVHENNQALYAIATLQNIAGEGLPANVGALVGQQIMVPAQVPEVMHVHPPQRGPFVMFCFLISDRLISTYLVCKFI